MALLITKDVSIMGGIQTDQIYLRLNYLMDFTGTHISCNVNPYYDKSAFRDGIHSNKLSIPEIPDFYEWNSYDSLLDGELLTYMHTKIKTDLITDQFTSVPLPDPSTGDYQYDPSTGEIITEDILTKPKFAEDGEITFVDLD